MHQKKVRRWKQILLPLTTNPNQFVIVELHNEEQSKYGKVYGNSRNHAVIRHACSQSGIISQMLQAIELKIHDGSYGFKKNTDPYCAASAIREIIYRHRGALLGDPREIYETAKFPFSEDVQELY